MSNAIRFSMLLRTNGGERTPSLLDAPTSGATASGAGDDLAGGSCERCICGHPHNRTRDHLARRKNDVLTYTIDLAPNAHDNQVSVMPTEVLDIITELCR